MSDKSIEKRSVPIAALWDALCSKYILLSLAAVVIALIAVLSGQENKYMLWETLGAFVLLAGTAAVQSFRLRSLGLSRKEMMKNKKSLDPRLMGSVEDISGIGSILSVIAGMSAAFAELFIIDGGIFSLESFVLPMLTALAGALSKGVALAFMTSQTNSMRLLYLISESSSEKEKVVKNAARATHFPEFMKIYGKMCSIRLTAAIALSLAIVMCSFGGAGAPYSCVETALLSVLVLILTGVFPKFDRGEYTEEKLPVWTKGLKSFCTFNVIVFLIITFVFMFTFPIRSVYTEYIVTHDFVYGTVVSAEIDAISAPVKNAENAALFTGFFAVSALFAIVCAASVNMDEKTGLSKDPAPYIICGAAAVLYPLAEGMIYPPCRFDAIMWLVIISFGCLILGMDLIGRAVILKNKSTPKNRSDAE